MHIFCSGLRPDFFVTFLRPVLDLDLTDVLFPAAISEEGLKSIHGGGEFEHPIQAMCLRFICSFRGPRWDIN